MGGEDDISSSPPFNRVVPFGIGLIAAIVLLLVAAVTVNHFVRVDLMLNRIDRYITATSGGLDRHFDLAPSLFRAGQPLAEARSELEAAGYRPYADDIFVQNGETLPEDAIVYGKDGGSGLMRLICSISYLVILDPDGDDAIRSASAHVQSACL